MRIFFIRDLATFFYLLKDHIVLFFLPRRLQISNSLHKRLSLIYLLFKFNYDIFMIFDDKDF